MFKRIFQLWIFFAAGTLLSAQEAPSTVRINFSVFPLGPGDWSGLYYSPVGDPRSSVEEIFFNPHERTMGYRYSGPAEMHFYREWVDAEGALAYRTIATADLLPTNEDRILFFQPSPEQTKRFKVDVMIETPDSFPDQSIVFYNTTNVPFFGKLGSQHVELRPGISDPIDVSPYFEEPAPIALVVNDGKKLRKVLMNKLRFSPQRRTLFILRPPKEAGSLRIRSQRLTEFTGPRESINQNNI